MPSHFVTIPLKICVRAEGGTERRRFPERRSPRRLTLQQKREWLEPDRFLSLRCTFSEGGRIEGTVQRDFRLSAKMALLRDALGRTKLKPGRFHDGVFSSVWAGTIFATVLS